MTLPKDDPFAWRNEGWEVKIGTEEDGGVLAMIEINDQLFFVTKKSIHSILLPDSIDPKRTNTTIPHTQQKVFPYGTEEPFVGRTLLQAYKLFEKHSLPDHVDTKKALNIAFSFVKEVATLHEVVGRYTTEEKKKNLSFGGKLGTDNSLQIPSIDNLEQQVKQIVNGVDHAMSLVIDMVRLFYPDIKNRKWAEQLIEKLEREKDSGDTIEFVEEVKLWVWIIRNLRNAIEHPTPENRIDIKNYRLKQTGSVEKPTLAFINPDTPFPELPVLTFATNTVGKLVTCFELLMAHLCNLHAQPFADDIRSVVEIPEAKRHPTERHVRFGYHIAWTK